MVGEGDRKYRIRRRWEGENQLCRRRRKKGEKTFIFHDKGKEEEEKAGNVAWECDGGVGRGERKIGPGVRPWDLY